ncbi:unnamed protein product [Ectocarpus sp. 13 AM-2016]
MRGAPFTKKKDGKVRDRSGEVIDLFPGVREALLEVHRGHRFRDTKLAIASRTSHERWARQVMGLIELEPGLLMRSVFSFTEIYSGSKCGSDHFRVYAKPDFTIHEGKERSNPSRVRSQGSALRGDPSKLESSIRGNDFLRRLGPELQGRGQARCHLRRVSAGFESRSVDPGTSQICCS